MNTKKLLKELERALRQDPENLVLRLKVAAAMREVGRRDEAVAMYRSVAVAYHKQNRLAQAIAVCRSVLEIEPSQRETQALLAELDIARQNKDALVPFAASLPPPSGATPRPRSATSPPPRVAPPPSVPSLPRLQPVGGRGGTLPPPLPPTSASGITPLPLPSIGSITPLPDHDDFLSPPRLPLPAQPSGPMAAQSPPREPAPMRPPPRETAPPMRRNTGAPPPTPGVPPARGTPPANVAPPRAPAQELPDEPSGPQLTVPGRPMARMTAPLPGVTQSPASTPPPQRMAPPRPPPRPTAPPSARTSESAPRPPARISEAPPPHQARPPAAPQPPARAPAGPTRLPPPAPRPPAPPPPPASPTGRPAAPAATGPLPPASRPPAARPPGPSQSPPAPRPPISAPRPQAPLGRPLASMSPPAASASAPPAARKTPTSVSQMTPTPMIPTPLPQPHAATPTPADAGPPSIFRPPYVHVPGQDDDGMTLPTIKSKVSSATAMRPHRGVAPAEEDALTASDDEATRIADEPREREDENATRVADEPRAGGANTTPARAAAPTGARSTPASPAPARPSPSPLPTRPAPAAREDADATRVAEDPAAMAAAFEAISADDDAPTGGLERLTAEEAAEVDDGDDVVVDGTETGDDDNATKVATDLRAAANEGPILDDGSPPVRAFPADLAPFSRADRLLDVGWPAGAARDTGEHGHGELTEPGRSPHDDGEGRTGDEVDEEGRTHTSAHATEDGKRKTTISRIRSIPEAGDDILTTRHDRLEPEEVNTGGPTAVSVDTDDDDEPEDGLELARAFDRGFGPDLGELAPDGSTIEQPLPLFARLSRAALSELQRRMSFRRCASGDLILREGDPGDACYVVYSGSVRVLKRDPSGSSTDVIEIARLGPGAIFGEFALLADRRRHASVQALEACELYEIPRRLLSELAAEYADVGPALERFYRERLLSTLLATAPFFQPLPEEDRANLMTRFVSQRIEAGGAIIREGESGGGLYLVVLGTVDITRRADGKRAVLLATLGEGAYFGEMSLLSGGRASATVTAAGPVELAQLSPRDFYEIVSAYPVIWEELRREAHRRELFNQNILAGDTRMV